jgi:hypothetical protein
VIGNCKLKLQQQNNTINQTMALISVNNWTRVVAILLTITCTDGFVPAFTKCKSGITSKLYMAIDYNDPVVAAEFANVQPMDFEDVEAELKAKGIPVAPTIT